jgi:hypothetical protein
LALDEKSYFSQRDFSLIFYDSGKNVESFVKEFNMFCDGTHYAYNDLNRTRKSGLDGSKGAPDFRITQTGNMNDQGGVVVEDFKYTSLAEIFVGITKELSVKFKSVVLRHSGNPTLVVGPEADTTVQHIFIGACGLSVKIVDVFEPLKPMEKAEAVASGHLIEVDFFRALTLPDYFLTSIAEAELKFEQSLALKKTAACIIPSFVDHSKLSPSEYLARSGLFRDTIVLFTVKYRIFVSV